MWRASVVNLFPAPGFRIFGRLCEHTPVPTQAHNKVWLVKRIAWRLQAVAERLGKIGL
jgi:hypothetical protein